MFKITAKAKPKWHNLRWKLSNALVGLARRIYPKNPEVDAFMLQVMTDQIIYGQGVFRVAPKGLYMSQDVRIDTESIRNSTLD